MISRRVKSTTLVIVAGIACALWCAFPGEATAQAPAAPASQAPYAPEIPPPGTIGPPASVEKGQGTLEIPVPKAFDGCWSGLNAGHPDSLQSGGLQIGGWIPTEVTLCLRKPAEGPWEITYTESKQDTEYAAKHGHPVSDLHAHTEIVSTDGENQIWLRTVTSVNEKIGSSWLLPDALITITGVLNSRCVLSNDRQSLNIQSSHLDRYNGPAWFERNGEPWTLTTWHTQLHRTPIQNVQNGSQ
jgi:hypothetical protein